MKKINAMAALLLALAVGAAAAAPGVPVPMQDSSAVVSASAASSQAIRAHDVALAISRAQGDFKLSASMRVGVEVVSLTAEGKLEAVGTPVDGAQGVARIHGKDYPATVHLGNRACDSKDVCYELAVATIHGWKGSETEVTMTGR